MKHSVVLLAEVNVYKQVKHFYGFVFFFYHWERPGIKLTNVLPAQMLGHHSWWLPWELMIETGGQTLQDKVLEDI